jgi:5S rRNA maturation endonuclease (ribonuclease M5)
MKSIETNYEEFLELLKELNERLVIVEGKRDVNALSALGLKHILPLNSMSPANLVLGIYSSGIEKEVVILTDFDRKGRALALELRRLLQAYKIRVNGKLRAQLRVFGKGKIEDFKK